MPCDTPRARKRGEAREGVASITWLLRSEQWQARGVAFTQAGISTTNF